MECVFCKIVEGKIPSYKIYEDKEFLAILDVNPNVRGMTLVLTKKHYSSYIFEMDDELFCKFLKFAKKIAKLLDKKLGVKRTAIVMEGLGDGVSAMPSNLCEAKKHQARQALIPKKSSPKDLY